MIPLGASLDGARHEVAREEVPGAARERHAVVDVDATRVEALARRMQLDVATQVRQVHVAAAVRPEDEVELAVLEHVLEAREGLLADGGKIVRSGDDEIGAALVRRAA